MGGQPAQPDAGHVLRVLDHVVHVVRTVGARGAGLGTIGLPPTVLEALARQVGFGRFRVLDFEDPANLSYEIRP